MTEVYVTQPAVPGNLEGGDGSQLQPFHSVARGMEFLKANGGGIVHVSGGQYVESVRLQDFGDTGDKMVVRGVGDDEVFIDSMLPEFLVPQTPDDHWFEVTPPDGGDSLGEYYWRRPYPAPGTDEDAGGVQLGAFLEEPVHTRLVSYDRIEDLTATDEIWPDRPTAGNRVWRQVQGEPGMYTPQTDPGKVHFRPWVYMGPGIWFDTTVREDSDDQPGGRRVHIRLAPTANNIPGWPDYDPPTTDPNQVRLALCRRGDYAIFLRRVSHVRFENLTLRFGNPDTIRLNSCTDIVFAHCRIRSASRALFLVSDHGPNADIKLKHCVIDGGIPTWLFRSDRKDSYVFSTDDPSAGTIRPLADLQQNRLGASTSGVQLSSSSEDCVGTVVHHCEIFNAHDSYVFGDRMEFHHNWVHNLNDDGIALSGTADTKNARIYCNVMTQCLTALSFAAGRKLGDIHIYANLFDLREPTLGRRPSGGAVPDSLRQGHFFKDGSDEGPIYLFHNTCLVFDPGARGDDRVDLNRAGYSYYATIGNSKPRPAYNNIFVAAFTPTAELKPIAYLPPMDFGPTDGNTYLRIPQNHPEPSFIVRRAVGQDVTDSFLFLDLNEYQQQYWPNDEANEYEHDGQLLDPGFKSFDVAAGHPHRGDDLRLRLHPPSPARGTAVEMPANLTTMYTDATDSPPADRGCFPSTGARLHVGVNGRYIYPRPLPEGQCEPEFPPAD